MQEQKLELILHNRRLLVSRLNGDGENVGKRFKWTIRRNSILPREMFHLIFGFVRHRVSKCREKDFDTIRSAIRRALLEAGEACGCKPERKTAGGDLAWYLNSEPLIAFQIHAETPTKKRVKKMLRGKAPLRWVITINEKKFRFLPQETRQEPRD